LYIIRQIYNFFKEKMKNLFLHLKIMITMP